jgi:hypothetical protein
MSTSVITAPSQEPPFWADFREVGDPWAIYLPVR